MTDDNGLQFQNGSSVAVNPPTDSAAYNSMLRDVGDAKIASSTFRSLPTNTMSSSAMGVTDHVGGGALQQLSDLLGQTMKLDTFADLKGNMPTIPINDLRGEEAAAFTRDECVLRRSLAALYRLMDIRGWSHSIYNHISARSTTNPRHFLINPFGLLYHEIRASNLVKIDDEGNVIEQGSTVLGVNKAGWTLHSALHSARGDISCIVHVHLPDVIAVSCLRAGLLPVSSEAIELILTSGVRYHDYRGLLVEETERATIQADIGSRAKILFLRNHGVAVAASSIAEAWYLIRRVVVACQTQMRMLHLSGGASLLVELKQAADRLTEQHEQQRQEPIVHGIKDGTHEEAEGQVDGQTSSSSDPVNAVNGKLNGAGGSEVGDCHWSPEDLEFEAEMRVLDSAGFRTGHIYHQPNLLRRTNGGGGWAAGDTLATTCAELGTTDFSATECCFSSSTVGALSDDVVTAAEVAGAQQVAKISNNVKVNRQRGAQRSQWLSKANEANGSDHGLPYPSGFSAACMQQRSTFPSTESPVKVAGLSTIPNEQQEATPVKRALHSVGSPVNNGGGPAVHVTNSHSDGVGFQMKIPVGKSATLPPASLQQRTSPNAIHTTSTLQPSQDGYTLSADEDEKHKPEKKIKKKGSFRMPSFSRKKK